jgi:hypothetical protein
MADEQDSEEGFAGRYSVQRGETGNGGVAGTVEAIIAGGAITAAGIGGNIAAARALTPPPETTAAGQDMGDGWRR